MYQAGDYIIFGSKGVCRVEAVGTLNVNGIPKDKNYYTLRPSFENGSKIYTPVDNDKIIMRPILTREEAMMFIHDIKNIDILWVTDEKRREAEYKEAFKKCDYRELIKVIKTIYLRKQSKLKDGKKSTSLDTKYFQLAEDYLYGELVISLNMDMEAVKELVISELSDYQR